MDALAGVSCTRSYTLILDGRPQPGAALLYTLWDPLGAAVLTAQPATDAGDGSYTYPLDGSTTIPTAGTYRERWAGSYLGRDLLAEGPVLVGGDSISAITRRGVRWECAAQLEDHWLGTVTDAAIGLGGAPWALTVPDLVAPEGDWEGAEVYVYAGTGRGQARMVTGSGEYNGVLETAAWTTLPTGASVEIHRRYRKAQYDSAINRAIRQAREAWLPMEDVSLLQVQNQTEYPIPAGLVWLASVAVEGQAGSGSYVELLRRLHEWDATPGRLTVGVIGDGCRMRLRGYRAPQDLTADEQYADLDAGYLIPATCSWLAASEIAAPALDRHAAAGSSAYYQSLAAAQLRRSALQNAVRCGL